MKGTSPRQKKSARFTFKDLDCLSKTKIHRGDGRNSGREGRKVWPDWWPGMLPIIGAKPRLGPKGRDGVRKNETVKIVGRGKENNSSSGTLQDHGEASWRRNKLNLFSKGGLYTKR